MLHHSPTNWRIEPIAPALGARVIRENPTAPLDDAEKEALASLLDEVHVVGIEAIALAHAEHQELARCFGEPLIHPFLESVEDYPHILVVHKDPADDDTFGGQYWHADITFIDPPASVSLLQAQVLPSIGGDTLFANQHLAFEGLSDGMQTMLRSLRAVHSYPDMVEELGATAALHPVVRVHPHTGREALFVNPAFVHRFEDMTVAESAPLLKQLFEHQIRPEYQARVRWSPNMLLLWDNRSVLHYAINDYPGQRRTLCRVTAMEVG